MNRSVFAVATLLLAACSSPTNTGGGVVTADSGTAAATDVVTGGGADSGSTARDAGTVRDSGTTPRDGGSTTRDAGAPDPFNYGTCGRAVISALCQCGMNDQACQQTALGRSQACITCMQGFQSTCCPTEIDAVTNCAMTSMCQDQNCLQTMCRMQLAAATTCVNTRLQREAMGGGGTCVDAYLGCLGDLPTMQPAVCASF